MKTKWTKNTDEIKALRIISWVSFMVIVIHVQMCCSSYILRILLNPEQCLRTALKPSLNRRTSVRDEQPSEVTASFRPSTQTLRSPSPEVEQALQSSGIPCFDRRVQPAHHCFLEPQSSCDFSYLQCSVHCKYRTASTGTVVYTGYCSFYWRLSRENFNFQPGTRRPSAAFVVVGHDALTDLNE